MDELTAGATSFQDYPLSERDRAWDGAAAMQRWQDECGIGGDNEDWSRFHDGFFWFDSASPETVGAHHLLFVDVIDGAVTAVWRGVTTCAAAMQGSRGARMPMIPDADKERVRSHIGRYYDKARDEYDDPSIVAPWEDNAAGGETASADAALEQPEQLADAAAPEIQPARPADVTGLAFHVTLAPEGKATDDGRVFAPDSISWREPPLTMMAMTETGPGGHEGAELAGRIDTIYRTPGDRMTLIEGDGMFDAGEYGREIARLVGERTLRGNSVDLAIRRFTVGPREQYVDADGYWIAGDPAELAEPTDEELLDAMFSPDSIFVILDAVIGMSTVCPFPAFEEGEVSLAASAGPTPATITLRGGTVELQPSGLTASGVGAAPVVPPAEWFDDPGLDEPTPLTVTDDGRVYGHAALWGTCHIGIPDSCTMAPQSATDYAYFHLKEVDAVDGDGEVVRVAVGTVTVGGPHAGRTAGRQAAVEHYDHTGWAGADVRAGEDEHGIWIAGAVRPDLPVERLRELRGATLSGDWRRVAGNLELVALLAVNVPGFPVPRPRALVASGADGDEVLTLLSAGIPAADAPDVEALSEHDLEQIRNLAAAARGGLLEQIA